MTNETIIELVKNHLVKKFELKTNLSYISSWYCNITNKKYIYDISVADQGAELNVSCTITANGFLSKLDLANPKTKISISKIHFSYGYSYNQDSKKVL